mmetsp:Transcript_5847/g.20384  ORF Transcript_5847/g.20384 Transcript_5847/m.20384 type:complete len:453 (-) Transcript_5847:1341-2699(-)|eukprot:CAMPEP_0183788906 /NCGR_PEP_ID=MMETSP0803_2-20130417/53_1 /TAXON_ID=195967 /ORGANISM="Crustomastix stigmata, Strain CCMP3273" /LENGTH=452 /DNA_ID=CAMNT_0026033055 /DNA_START=70 /DNA_END=1428 /DNA_ORIENTATION=+
MELRVRGDVPPTATRAPTRTSTKGMSGKSLTSATATELKRALTEALVKKMREKFSTLADDIKASDAIGTEVVNFMAINGSVNEEDIHTLEEKIRCKLLGVPQRSSLRLAIKDEWAEITKWEAEQNAKEEKRLRETLKERQKKLKCELDAQVKEKLLRKQSELQQEMEFAEQELEELERWKLEEKNKLEEKMKAAEKLRAERDEQLTDQQARREQAMEVRKAEEEEAAKLLKLEHQRKVKEEEVAKKKMQDEMKTLLFENQARLRMQEETKAKENEEDLKFQLEYAKRLELQEQARQKNLSEMKQKQLRAERQGNERGEYKRWMDEKIIEKNFREREAQLDQQEEAALAKIQDLNMEQRKVLAQQLEEKKQKKQLEDKQEATRMELFNKSLSVIEAREKKLAEKTFHKVSKHKAELEAQMHENYTRKRVTLMNPVERSMNSKLLQEIESSKRK